MFIIISTVFDADSITKYFDYSSYFYISEVLSMTRKDHLVLI